MFYDMYEHGIKLLVNKIENSRFCENRRTWSKLGFMIV